MEIERIEEDLSELSRRLGVLPEVPEPPLTTLQVVGRPQRERFWQRLLVYFLTPDEPHGLGDELLDHVLNALSASSRTDFTYSRLTLEDARVREETSTENGRPDLLIWSGEEWFVCVEMKVGAAEGKDQTQRYVSSSRFNEIGLEKEDIPQSGHHYLYLAPEDTGPPQAEEFVHLPWGTLADYLDDFTRKSHGRHSARTTAQIDEFIDTIRSELTMTEHEANQREKAALAVQYHDTITEINGALEDYAEDLRTRWPDWLVDREPPSWNKSWQTRISATYASIFLDEWAINYAGDNVGAKHSDLLVIWEVRLDEWKIAEKGVDAKLLVKSSDKELRSKLHDRYHEEEIQKRVSERVSALNTSSGLTASTGGWERKAPLLVRCAYDFDLQETSFESAYVELFEEMQPIFDIITECMPENAD